MKTRINETDSPKVTSVRVKLSKEEESMLLEIVHITRRTMSDIIREGIELVYKQNIGAKKN